MKRRGHAVHFPPGVRGVIGKFYNMLLDDGHVDSKLLGKVLDACPTLYDKVHFMNALLLQPPTDQQREWIEAFGVAWRWTDIISNAKDVREVTSAASGGHFADIDARTLN